MESVGHILVPRESVFRILHGEGVPLSGWARFLAATLLVGAALAARVAMLPVNGGFAFVTFYPAVILSALLFGTGPGLLTLVLSAALAHYIFMPPFWSFALRTDQLLPLATFLFSGGLTCYLAHLLHHAVLDLRASNRSLQSTVEGLRASEHALRVAEQRLRTIANNVPAMIGYWGRDLRCEFANEEYRAWFGVTPAQALGMRMPDLLGQEIYKLNEPYVQGALAGHPQHFERALVKRDGSQRYTDARYVPDLDDGGKVRGFFVLVSDITERHASFNRVRELAQRVETVREEERRAVVQALHEGIAQDLFAARLMVGRLETQSRGRPPVYEACQELSAAIDQCLRVVRQVAVALRPSSFAHLGLAQALREHALYFGHASGLTIDVHAAETFPALDEDTGLMFFRAAQEALTNVARHARARSVDIVLRTAPDGIAMEICDDGIGVSDGALDKPGSLGLLGIRERFAARGGTLEVRRSDVSGTMFTVRLPITTISQA